VRKTLKISLLVLVALGLAGVAWFLARPKIAQAPDSSQPVEVVSTQSQTPLKFAVLSDIHSDLTNLSKALTKVKTDGDQFIIVTGDLTEVGTLKELTAVKTALDQSGLTYYAVPGNHDYWQSRNLSQPLFQQIFGYTYTSLTFSNHGGKIAADYELVLVDNGDDYKGIDGAQGQWLASQLATCHVVTCLVFMHEPLSHPTGPHVMGETTPAVAAQVPGLVKELVDANVKELFVGHLHYSSHYTKDGLTTTIVGAVTKDRNWQTPRFLEVTLEQPLGEREVVIE